MESFLKRKKFELNHEISQLTEIKMMTIVEELN